MLLFFKKAHHHIWLPRPLKRLLASPSDPSSLCSGQGVTVCDKLQCVCDKTTAECMAAAHFNHSLPAPQCHGSTPPCRRASRPPKPLRVSPQSSEESDMEVGDASSEEDTAANTPPPLQPPHRWAFYLQQEKQVNVCESDDSNNYEDDKLTTFGIKRYWIFPCNRMELQQTPTQSSSRQCRADYQILWSFSCYFVSTFTSFKNRFADANVREPQNEDLTVFVNKENYIDNFNFFFHAVRS